MDNGERIFENIQRLAYSRGKTVHDVCRKAKVSAGIISDLKHGRRNSLGKITLEKLSSELGCRIEDITEAEDGSPMPEAPKSKRIDIFIERAVESMHERPEMRRLVRAAMKANTQQVKSTAILLESITQAQKEGLFLSGDEQ